MLLKVNHLTHLHDARYCAAQGVEYVSFALGRGLDAKLPAASVAEIIGWVEGPRPVLDFGSDTPGLTDYLNTQPIRTDFLFQLEIHSHTPPALDAERVIWQMPFQSAAQLAGELPALTALAAHAHALELVPQGLSELELTQVVEVWLTLPAVFLNLDDVPVEQWPQLWGIHAPMGASVRKAIQADLLNLDYDRFEQVLEHLHREPFSW
jgi:hypothetical protein